MEELITVKILGLATALAAGLGVAISWINKKTKMLQSFLTKLKFYIQLIKRFK